jgi:hypothetical protein
MHRENAFPEAPKAGAMIPRTFEFYSSWSSWSSKIVTESEADLLIPESKGLESLDPHLLRIFDVAMPYVRGLPLNRLYDIMADDYDSFVLFRKALRSTSGGLAQALNNNPDKQQLFKLAVELRKDVIDPEISKLNLLLRKVVQSRALTVAGAAIGSASLVAATIASSGLAAAIYAGLGAGGLGLLAKEAAAWRSDTIALKENPWYFAWKLRRRAER